MMVCTRPLPEELQKKAIEEINEDPKRLASDLEYINTWLSQQQFISARKDDQLHVAFLRGCKFSLERTKEKLDMYYTIKKLLPEVYENRDPLLPDIQEILSNGIVLPLPKLADPAAPRVTLVQLGKFDPTRTPFSSLYKVSGMIQDLLIRDDDNFVIAGTQVIHDMENFTMGKFTHASPALAKKILICFYQSYPIRARGLYFTNTSLVFEAVNNLLKAFLPEKVKSRINAFTPDNIAELYKVIPKSILPEEYGGEGGKIADITAAWKKKIESNRDWFLEDSKYGTDEKKRLGKPKTSNMIFGVEGSFRQLAVD